MGDCRVRAALKFKTRRCQCHWIIGFLFWALTSACNTVFLSSTKIFQFLTSMCPFVTTRDKDYPGFNLLFEPKTQKERNTKSVYCVSSFSSCTDKTINPLCFLVLKSACSLSPNALGRWACAPPQTVASPSDIQSATVFQSLSFWSTSGPYVQPLLNRIHKYICGSSPSRVTSPPT